MLGILQQIKELSGHTLHQRTLFFSSKIEKILIKFEIWSFFKKS